MRLYGIFGTGGFAREVMPMCKEMLLAEYGAAGAEHYELVFVADGALPEKEINGHKVISEADFKSSSTARLYFNIAIADSKLREHIAARMEAIKATPFAIYAANYVRLDANKIGDGAIFCPFSMVTSNVKIGRYFHANFYSYVAHDCVIGDFVTLAPNASCNGNVVIEDHAYIGSGAIIKQGVPGKPLVIGKGAVVGMGAVVTKSVPPFSTVVGNPAKQMEIKS
jgi:sugar O-acyltransferase (sialic acid O-acetyltransferase NeuD family)